MRSRISWFDKTLYRKDLTRYAPIWGLYTLCLLGGMTMLYVSDGRFFWYAPRLMSILNSYMPVVNLLYAIVVAVLLFGDLYDSRMCNAIHALPLRRETIFTTHLLAGLTYSVLPGLLFALVSLPLLLGTCVVDAWALAPAWLLGNTLEFIFLFGLAVLCVFCAGNRFVALLLYAGVNGASSGVYFLIQKFYTPMLYGVITPESIAFDWAPLAHLTGLELATFEDYQELLKFYKGRQVDMVAHYSFEGAAWTHLALCGLVGIVFLAIALLLYRKRRLEYAGDALAVKVLEPAVPVAGALAGVLACTFFLELLPYTIREQTGLQYAFFAASLVVGWFAGEMLRRRSAQVFRKRSFLGLAALAGCLALSLPLTYFDVFRIDDRIPKAEDVASIEIFGSNYGTETFEDPEDIEKLLRLQELVLEERIEQSGRILEEGYYVSDGPTVEYGVDVRTEDAPTMEELEAAAKELDWQPYRQATWLHMTFHLTNGRTMERSYFFWSEGEARELMISLSHDWDSFYKEKFAASYDLTTDSFPTELDLDHISRISLYGGTLGKDLPREETTRETAQSLLDALRKDYEAGHLHQNRYLHDGYFAVGWYAYEEEMDISISTSTGILNISVFPDSENTLNWLRAHDLGDFLVYHENVCPVIAAPAGS